MKHKNKYFYFFITLLLLYTSQIEAQCDFKTIGHRGGSSFNFPENTLISLEQGFIEGIYAAEVDLRYTKDSVLVLCHDYYLERTTNGHGLIENSTIEYLKTLDAGSWKSPVFKSAKIPTLLEALQLAEKYDKKLYLNVKKYAPYLLSKLMKENHFREDLILIDPDDLEKVVTYHKLMPKTRLIFFGDPPTDIMDTTFYKTLRDNGVMAAEVLADEIKLDKQWVKDYKIMLKKYGMDIWAYTVDNSDYMFILKKFGIQGLETDRPTEAKSIFCDNKSLGFFSNRHVTGCWDFKTGLNARIGSGLALLGDTTVASQKIQFQTTDFFQIPGIEGKSVQVAKIPALDPDHSIRFFSNIMPDGFDFELSCDDTYSLIYDILKPTTTNKFTSLFQTSNNNSDDGDLFIDPDQNNAIGVIGEYHGSFKDNTWNRLVFVFDLPHNNLLKYVNGTLVGTTVIKESLKFRFCVNNNWSVQASNLFSDDDGETSDLFVSSVQMRDYVMTQNEINFLGGPKANKISDSVFINKTECPQIISQTNDTTVLVGAKVSLKVKVGSQVNYRWQVNKGMGWEQVTGVNCSGISSDNLQISDVNFDYKYYKYRCQLSNNCIVYTKELQLLVNKVNVGIESTENINLDFNIYPNPNNGSFIITSPQDKQTYNLSIKNSQGVEVYQTLLQANENQRIEKTLPNGLYFVSIISNKAMKTKKIIVN